MLLPKGAHCMSAQIVAVSSVMLVSVTSTTPSSCRACLEPTAQTFCCLPQELRLAAVADMPPEAILQRPSVLANVLALLQSADSNSPLPAAALRLLHALVCRVTWALGMAKNELYLPNLKGELCSAAGIKLDAQLIVMNVSCTSHARSCRCNFAQSDEHFSIDMLSKCFSWARQCLRCWTH